MAFAEITRENNCVVINIIFLVFLFRRCEDICWVKTNTSCPGNTGHLDPKAILVNVKEHCLMGIKGTVRRNQDGHFIHANIDLDIIITEEVCGGGWAND